MKYVAILIALGLLGYIGYKQFAEDSRAEQQIQEQAPPPPPAILQEPPPIVLDAASLERVRSSTRDTDPTVRWEAARFLLNSRDPQGLPTLLDMLHRDSEPGIRLQVITLLGDRRSPVVTRHIVQALTDTDAQVRLAALDDLAKIGDYSTAQAVSATLHDTDAGVRLKALQTLKQLQVKRSVEMQAAKAAQELKMKEWKQQMQQRRQAQQQTEAR